MMTLGMATDLSAAFIDGNKLVAEMWEYEKSFTDARDTDWPSVGQYQGFVIGVADVIDDMICSPANAQSGQYLAVVQKYLKNHPEQWSYPAYQLVLKALVEAFPCRPGQSQKR
jgi:hypothetical protein